MLRLSCPPVLCLVLALLVLVAVLFPPATDAQLTQSLGWGSAGSPGKRSSFFLRSPCRPSDEAVADVIATIQKEAERVAQCWKRLDE